MVATLNNRNVLAVVALLLLPLSVINKPANAAETSGSMQKKHVLELFTSHGCSSCPAADARLEELIGSRDDIVALEFHVDYWNDLVYGRSGSFTDPFSKPEWSLRQRYYNGLDLQGRTGVYTPQLVINGGYALIGSDNRVNTVLDALMPFKYDLTVSKENNMLRIAPDADLLAQVQSGKAGILLAKYRKEAETEITGGENKSKTLRNHNIVNSLTQVNMAGMGAGHDTFEVEVALAEGEHCAILVQSGATGRMLSASLCP